MTDARSEHDGTGSGAGSGEVSTPDPAPAGRPARPAYGEYAPEGWEWKPAEADTGAGGASGASGAGSAPAAGAGPIVGVPHNLGVSGTASSNAARGAQSPPPGQGAQVPQAQSPQAPAQQAPQSSGDPEPYRASAPQPSQAPSAPQFGAPHTGAPQAGAPQFGAPQAGAPRPRIADRIITIALLVLGAFGALNFAAAFMSLENQISLTASMFGIESPKIADWVGPLGVATGLGLLLLYALTLIFSIRRMRAGKLTFWAPLAAGVLALIIVFIVQSIALGGAPEIMQQLESDPNGALERMMDYLQQSSGSSQP